VTAGIEIELKLGLRDPASLGALLRVLPAPVAVREQRNHYLVDPEGNLARAELMLRAREEWDASRDPATLERVVITAKRRTSVTAGVFTAEEREDELPIPAWRDFLATGRGLAGREGDALAWAREVAGFEELRVLGVMTNLRRLVELEGFVLEVDETRFPDGTVDVEVEVETATPAMARAVVEDAAARAGVALFEQPLGKYARFLASLRRGP